MKPFLNPYCLPETLLETGAEPPCLQLEEEDWADADDTRQLEFVPHPSELKRTRTHGKWSLSFTTALLAHVLGIAILILLSARSTPITQWRVARGNPAAQDSASGTGSVQYGAGTAQRPPIGLLPVAPPIAPRQRVIEACLEDSSVLPTRTITLDAPDVDPVIGLVAAGDSQRMPHFAKTQPLAPTSNSKSFSLQQTGGASAPPHITGLRGNRDGFDSRGLPIPDYPPESQRRGEQGLVIVDVEVLPDGHVGAVQVDDDAGYPRLGSAAAQKVKLATFEPARVNGTPVVGHIRIPYRFTLE